MFHLLVFQLRTQVCCYFVYSLQFSMHNPYQRYSAEVLNLARQQVELCTVP